MYQNCPKRTFPVKNSKREHYHWIQDIRVIVSNKFQRQQTKLAPQDRFQSKTANLSINIKFNKIWLKQTILIFLKEFVQNGCSSQKRPKYSNYSKSQVSALTKNFHFVDNICQKKDLSDQKSKTKEHHHRFWNTQTNLSTKF